MIVADPDGPGFLQITNFSKAKKQGKKWRGTAVKGSKAGEKVKFNKKGYTISFPGYDKIFIPMNFKPNSEDREEIEEAQEMGEEVSPIDYIDVPAVARKALIPFRDEILEADYFTIRIMLGYEIGQRQSIKIPESKRRGGTKFGKGAEEERKVEIITSKLIENIQSKYVRERSKYAPLFNKFGNKLIDGVFLYKFKNQRAPTKTEKKTVKRKK